MTIVKFLLKNNCLKKLRECVEFYGFMDLEEAHDRVKWEALCQMLRMYDVNHKLLKDIKSVYINILSCIRVKKGLA